MKPIAASPIVTTLILSCLLASGCYTARYSPYSGAQQTWPTAPGSFVELYNGFPVIIGYPSQPYEVIGMVRMTADDDMKDKVVELAAREAKKRGGEAALLISESKTPAGSISVGMGSTSTFGNATINGNTISGSSQGITSSTSANFAQFEGHATVWVIRFPGEKPDYSKLKAPAAKRTDSLGRKIPE